MPVIKEPIDEMLRHDPMLQVMPRKPNLSQNRIKLAGKRLTAMGIVGRHIDDENATQVVIPQVPIECCHLDARDDTEFRKGANFNKMKIFKQLVYTNTSNIQQDSRESRFIFGRFSMQRRNAFTLIELLVVIAIIAILAAILFPVFAQAKMAAKKAVAISQAKQAGTGIILYSADVDDALPCGLVPNLSVATIAYRVGDFSPQSPAGWWNMGGTATAEYQLVWHNAIFPYTKSYQMLDLPGMNVQAPLGTPGVQLQAPVTNTLSYNGLLQYLSTTAIASPSQSPMLWQGFGNYGYKGSAVLSPRLNCNSTGPCMYNAGGPPQTGATGNPQAFTASYTPTYNIYGNVNIYVFNDSSAKAVSYGPGNQASFPASTNSIIPYQFFISTGQLDPNRGGIFYRGMGGLRGANYSAAFCPDNTFQN